MASSCPRRSIPACQELEAAFREAWADPAFRAELDELLRTYAGRPSLLYECRRLSDELGLRLLLKREDLNHTGSHKINNVLGQALLARRMGKTRLIAETGAGQHGVATATAAALLGMDCIVYMGEVDMDRQALNVFRMRLLGAEVVPVESGLAHAQGRGQRRPAGLGGRRRGRPLLPRLGDGPPPLPVDGPGVPPGHRRRGPGAVPVPHRARSRRGRGLRGRRLQRHRHLLRLRRAARRRAWSAWSRPAAPPSAGACQGVVHGMHTYLMQDEFGQVQEAESVSAGLDYPGVGPEHAHLHDIGRASYPSVTDDEVLDAFELLSRTEGIIPALESGPRPGLGVPGAGRAGRPDGAGQPVGPRRQGRGPGPGDPRGDRVSPATERGAAGRARPRWRPGALEAHLRERRARGRKLLVPYVTAGLDADWTEVVAAPSPRPAPTPSRSASPSPTRSWTAR